MLYTGFVQQHSEQIPFSNYVRGRICTELPGSNISSFRDTTNLNSATRPQLAEKAAQSRTVDQRVRETVNQVLPQKKNLVFFTKWEELSHHSWYWGPLSCEQADEVLSGFDDGAFLLRDSSHHMCLFSLSFKLGGKPRHARIENDSCGNFSLSVLKTLRNDSVVELVEQIRRLSLRGGTSACPVHILTPVSRHGTGHSPPSLQHFCRFAIRLCTSRDRLQVLPLPKNLIHYVAQENFFQYNSSDSH